MNLKQWLNRMKYVGYRVVWKECAEVGGRVKRVSITGQLGRVLSSVLEVC